MNASPLQPVLPRVLLEQGFPAAPATPVPRAAQPTTAEYIAVLAVLLLSALVQFHAVLHDGAMGQDFEHNYQACVLTAQDPGQAWYFAHTNPPGFHLMAAAVIRLVGQTRAVVAIGLINLGFSVAALAALYFLGRQLIARPVWRVALVTLAAFVPVRLIHGVVIASDALTLLPFFLAATLLCRLTTETRTHPRRWQAAGIGLLLAIGMCIKYTFMSSLVAVVLVLVQTVRRRRIAGREALTLAALGTALPLLVLFAQVGTQESFRNNFGMHDDRVDNMTYASVLGLRAADPHVLDAPVYAEPNRQPDVIPVFSSPDNDHDTRYELMIPNRYSYLALLHWSVFTDPLDIFQPRPAPGEPKQRTPLHQRLMTLAVRTALPITLACVAAMAWLAMGVAAGALLPLTHGRADVEAVWLLGLGWFGNIALLMPSVHGAYLGGYWTPRLVLPGLLTFAVLTFHVLDRCWQGRVARLAGGVVLGYVVWQSALQAAFLWA